MGRLHRLSQRPTSAVMSEAVDAWPDPGAQEEDLFLMSNAHPKRTGLRRTVFFSLRGGARHDVRVKVSGVRGGSYDPEGAVTVAVRPQPRILHGHLPPDEERDVLAWVRLNADLLVEHWEDRIDAGDVFERMRRV